MRLAMMTSGTDYHKNLENLRFIAKKINDIDDPRELAILELLKYNKRLSAFTIANQINENLETIEAQCIRLIEKSLIIKTIYNGEEVFMIRDKKLVKLLSSIEKSNYFLS